MENEAQIPPPSSEPPPPPSPPETASPPPPSSFEQPPVPAAAAAAPPPVPPANAAAPQETPAPSLLTDEKNLAMFCHLSALAGGLLLAGIGIGAILPVGNILGPLAIWLWKKDTMPLVNAHGKEALNFQITVSIALMACILTFFLLLPILLAVVIGIAALVLTIIGTVKASNGELYRYPFSLRLIK